MLPELPTDSASGAAGPLAPPSGCSGHSDPVTSLAPPGGPAGTQSPRQSAGVPILRPWCPLVAAELWQGGGSPDLLLPEVVNHKGWRQDTIFPVSL